MGKPTWKECSACGASVRKYGPCYIHSSNRYRVPMKLRLMFRETYRMCPKCWMGFVNSGKGRAVKEYIILTCEDRGKRADRRARSVSITPSQKPFIDLPRTAPSPQIR
jgi:hypothetical protein